MTTAGASNIRITWADTRWAATWENSSLIMFCAFDDQGAKSIPDLQVNSLVGLYFAGDSHLCWTGSAFVLAFAYKDAQTTPIHLHVTALDSQGAVSVAEREIVPQGFQHALSYDPVLGRMALAWCAFNPDYHYEAAVVNANGMLGSSPQTVSPTATLTDFASIPGNVAGFGFACRNWASSGPLGAPDAYFTPLDATLTPLSSPIPMNGDHFRTGQLVWTGAAYMWPVEFYEVPTANLELYVYRLDRMGNPLGSRQAVSSGAVFGSSDLGPDAAMADATVGIVWQDFRQGGGTPDTWFASVPTVEVLLGGGAGALNPPRLKSLSAFKAEGVLDFLAYGGSGYGLNLAAGSIDTKPLEEIVTGPGPGAVYGPQVRAFTGGEESIGKVNFYAYGTLKYGVHVGTGDVDGDGMEEILTGPGPGSVFGPHVRGWNFDGASISPLGKVSYYAYSTLKYGAEVAAGDVDGDNYHELITGPGPGVIFGAHLRGWNYDSANVTAMGKINAFVFTTKNGLLVGAGDLTADGKEEILASAGPDPAATSEVRAYSASGTLTQVGSVVPFTTMGGSHVGAGDMTLDGHEELVTTPGFVPANPGRTKAYDFGSGTFQSMPPWDQDVFPGLAYGATCAIGNVGI